MEKSTWKILTIILLVILIVENAFMIIGYLMIQEEQEKRVMCYYNICSDYPDAEYDVDYNVCYCYDYYVLGNYVIDKTEYMG